MRKTNNFWAFFLEYVSLCKKMTPSYFSSERDANSLNIPIIDASTLIHDL